MLFLAEDDDLPEQVADFIAEVRFTDIKVLLLAGVLFGWTATKRKGYLLVSEDGITVDLPISTLNAKVFRSRFNTLVTHRSAAGTGSKLPLAAVNWVVEKLKVEPSRAQVMREAALKAHPLVSAPASAGTTAEVQPEQAPKGTHRKRRITRQEPWNAHGSTRKDGVTETYPSPAVIERQWSDDTVDYRCSWDECEFISDSPRSVAAHYANVHTRGQGRQPQPPADGIDPDHTPRKTTRIRNLRRELDSALNAAFAQSIDWSVTDQAEWLATWIIEHRVEAVRGSDTELEGVSDLDNDQILDRIAALVDRGRSSTLREQIAALNEQLDEALVVQRELQQKFYGADDARAQAEDRARKAVENLHALRDMINEASPE